ncbi:MAG: hypothetical protein CMA27_05675 [Euryarchaeota archaeon]|nr:hypothetical protein [Euryarchaeota archaeon]
MDINLIVLCLGLFLISILYSSVGHGGASGYLAILSLSTFASMESSWLKQHVWCLNLVVAAIAFYHYYKAGFYVKKFTIPFILGSVPFAIIGGALKINGDVYDYLLSITLIWAAYRLYQTKEIIEKGKVVNLSLKTTLPIGGSIGFLSGVIGVGGGIFLSPILLLKKWADPKSVATTSALFIWVNSAAGLFGAGLSKQLEIDLNILLPFIVSVIIGGYIGSKFGSNTNQSKIKSILIIVLIIAALKRILEFI